MTRPRLIAAGGAHVDRRGRVVGAYVAGASNPGTMREEIGGGAFNALRVAVQRGVAGALLSARGGDAAGTAVAEEIAKTGIEDLSAVFLDRATPSYTALLDERGELIAGLADMGLYDTGFPRHAGRRNVREALAAADALLVDANVPASALAALTAAAAGKPVFAIAVSPAKVGHLAGLLETIDCLFMTLREARSLAGLDAAAPAAAVAQRLRDRGLRGGVITAGAAPVHVFDRAGVQEIAPPKPRRIADVTGAGDALAGAAIAALLDGTPLSEAMREGLAAALLAVESAQAVPDCGEPGFDEALALVGAPSRVA